MTGREKFIDLFETIRHARHHIHLEYFNFRNDSIANALFDLLAEKVKEGVEVRAMFDAFGNWSNNQPLKKHHLQAIKARGIELVKFDPITFPYINHAMHRDHRKIVVIDGKIGYTGGMNIADYYINGLPKIGKWHDIHMHIEGDAVVLGQDGHPGGADFIGGVPVAGHPVTPNKAGVDLPLLHHKAGHVVTDEGAVDAGLLKLIGCQTGALQEGAGFITPGVKGDAPLLGQK